MKQKRSLLMLALVCALLCALLVCCVAAGGAETAFQNIVYGMKGDQVTEIQQKPRNR